MKKSKLLIAFDGTANPEPLAKACFETSCKKKKKRNNSSLFIVPTVTYTQRGEENRKHVASTPSVSKFSQQ